MTLDQATYSLRFGFCCPYQGSGTERKFIFLLTKVCDSNLLIISSLFPLSCHCV